MTLRSEGMTRAGNRRAGAGLAARKGQLPQPCLGLQWCGRPGSTVTARWIGLRMQDLHPLQGRWETCVRLAPSGPEMRT